MRLALIVVASILTFGSSAAQAGNLHASFQETFNIAPCGLGILCVTALGTGQSAHLGASTVVDHVTIDLSKFDPTTGCVPDTDEVTLTAANGDQLFLHSSLLECLTATGTTFTGTYVVIDGTGRFAGATGSGSVTGVTTRDSATSGTSVVTYEGTLARSHDQDD